MASEAPSKDADYRDVGTKMGESGVKGFAYGCILGLFLANWRETSGKGATARAVAAQGPEAVRAYMWNARAQMAGTVAKYGAFMGAASAAYVAWLSNSKKDMTPRLRIYSPRLAMHAGKKMRR